MRKSVVYTTVCALALLSVSAALAQTTPATAPTSPATPKPSREASVPTTPVVKPSQDGFISEDLFRDDGATAQCRDGTYFHGYATARTCSDHGGLLRWLRGPDRPTLR